MMFNLIPKFSMHSDDFITAQKSVMSLDIVLETGCQVTYSKVTSIGLQKRHNNAISSST